MLCCVLQKFACTTLRPTCLPYKELYEWDGAASFVMDYITCSPLHPPDELVEQNPHYSLITLFWSTPQIYKPNGNLMDPPQLFSNVFQSSETLE